MNQIGFVNVHAVKPAKVNDRLLNPPCFALCTLFFLIFDVNLVRTVIYLKYILLTKIS